MTRLHPSFFDAPITHRGLHNSEEGVIENSMTAVKRAVAHGYGIEIDVQPAADLTPMVFHDYMLDRLTAEKGPIKSKRVEALQSIKLKGSEDTIPTLAEVLDEVGGRVPLLIEIKDQDMRLGPNIGAFQDKVCAALDGYDGPAALMSFSPDTMARVAELAPDIAIGLVTDPFEAEDWPNVPQDRRAELAAIPDAKPLGVDFISHQQRDLSSDRVRALKEDGVAVFCWTIRSPEDEARARKVADNITFEGYSPG